MIQVVCTEQNDYVIGYKNFKSNEVAEILEYVKKCLDTKETIKIALIKYPFKEN